MARQKLKEGQKTVPLVTHIPVSFKKKIVAAAKAKEITIAEFVRSSLEKTIKVAA